MRTVLRAGALAIALTGLVTVAGAQSLTSAEEAQAVRLAQPQGAIQAASALHPDAAVARGTSTRVVVSRVEPVRSDDPSRRLAVVTLYQYEGNVTTNRLVDLDSNTVINERTGQDVGTPVADVEAEYARSLLMSDRRVSEMLAPFQGQVDIGLIPTVVDDPADPQYGKRIVRALINTPQGFVTGVQISVNLSDATVNVQQ
jgi:hypothetical protein